MGNGQSNNLSSEIDTLNWSDNIQKISQTKKNKNGIEIIDIDFNFTESEVESDRLDEVFQKLNTATTNLEKNNHKQLYNSVNSPVSSPFISTEMYNKIMSGDDGQESNSTSPFINTQTYNKIMKGGDGLENNSTSPYINTEAFNKIIKGGGDDSSSSSTKDSDDSTSDSDILKGLSEISVSSIKNKRSNKRRKSKSSKRNSLSSTSSEISNMNKKLYGFSNTSPEIIKTSEDNYYLNNVTSDTPYKIDSSSINTSDINLVSVNSRNGRRFI